MIDEFRLFIQIVRKFYRVPINAVDYQCYSEQAPTYAPVGSQLISFEQGQSLALSEQRRFYGTLALCGLITVLLLLKIAISVLFEDSKEALEQSFETNYDQLEQFNSIFNQIEG